MKLYVTEFADAFELNYMRETRSNTIGRYVMLSFKYRLNKFAKKGGLEVDFHRKH